MDFKKIELSILNQNKKDIVNIIQKYNIENIHVDIMDWYFTNSLSNITPYLLKNIDFTNKNLHLHFMVNDIEKYYNYYKNINNILYISYHYENNIINEKNYINFNKKLHKKWIKVWLVLNPETTINEIDKVILEFDFVQIMTVIPWLWWQSFIENMKHKIIDFKNKYKDIPLYIDWWVNNLIYDKYNKYIDIFIIWSYLYK